ncbi:MULTISPECIES: SCO family protein [Hyphobacterium]|uniref:SCO family protein n=1 Tax=Hyphobacterium vulgare TaxID=1736751 RepID=A0ABV6ZWZ9_9PROT
MPFSRQPVWIYALLAGVAALAIMFGVLMLTGTRDSGPIVRTSGQAQIGGPFTLVNQDGETVTDADFRGKAMLIYFGFTYCPDICPFSLQTMDAALAQLSAADRARVQPILISVDPRRDTSEALATYVQSDAFPDGLVGLTGTPEQIAQVTQEYRVIYRETEEGQEDDSYLVDHTSFIYLMDFEGEFVTVFSHGHTPQAIADTLQDFLDQERSS